MAYEHAHQALIRFETSNQMEERLSGLIADRLALSISQKGKASLALSGGKTPSGLYAYLSHAAIDWAKVQVTLVDERFVQTDHSASNERVVRETLLHGSAARAEFLGLRGTAATLGAAATDANKRLKGMTRPFDVTVLGMGTDGHTASWFTGATGLEMALDVQNPKTCVPVTTQNSPIAGEHKERLTLTLSALENAVLCVLLLNGQDKFTAYERALSHGPVKDMPIRAILKAKKGAFWPCWAP